MDVAVVEVLAVAGDQHPPHEILTAEVDVRVAAVAVEPLRFVPKGKVIVLGLISTKVPELEKVDELKRRIEAAAKYIPLDQLAISPQCGFASDVVGNLLTEDDQRRKLELVVETGKTIQVPLFIKEGEKVKVSTETREFAGRA